MDKSAAVKVSDPSMVIDDLKLMQTLHLPNILAQHRLRNGDIKTRLYPVAYLSQCWIWPHGVPKAVIDDIIAHHGALVRWHRRVFGQF
jgi:hypothetical protein